MFYVEVSPPITAKSGDVLLLCSDGLWSPLLNNEIAEVLAEGTLPVSMEQLVEIALSREKKRADNTTAVVARLGDSEEEHKTDLPMCEVLDYR
jgi:protein phosphatase